MSEERKRKRSQSAQQGAQQLLRETQQRHARLTRQAERQQQAQQSAPSSPLFSLSPSSPSSPLSPSSPSSPLFPLTPFSRLRQREPFQRAQAERQIAQASHRGRQEFQRDYAMQQRGRSSQPDRGIPHQEPYPNFQQAQLELEPFPDFQQPYPGYYNAQLLADLELYPGIQQPFPDFQQPFPAAAPADQQGLWQPIPAHILQPTSGIPPKRERNLRQTRRLFPKARQAVNYAPVDSDCTFCGEALEENVVLVRHVGEGQQIKKQENRGRGHYFHYECPTEHRQLPGLVDGVPLDQKSGLLKWLIQGNDTCPLCRIRIAEIIPVKPKEKPAPPQNGIKIDSDSD